MSKIGKFIFKKFLGQTIEIFSDLDSEWLNLEQVSVYNKYTIVGLVKGYDEDTDILELVGTNEYIFYINPENIYSFWVYDPDFNFFHNLKKTMPSGRNFSFDKDKHKEKMDKNFNEYLSKLKKPKI